MVYMPAVNELFSVATGCGRATAEIALTCGSADRSRDDPPCRVAAFLEDEDYDVISFGESAIADEGAGDAGEGEEVLGLALVAAVQSAASGEPGHRAFYGPAVAAQTGRGLDALAGDAVPDAAPA